MTKDALERQVTAVASVVIYEVNQVKVTRFIIFPFVKVGVVPILFILAAAGVAAAQTNAPHSASATRVDIPYDFWIVGTRLAAGEYTLSPVVDTVVLFRNVKTKANEQASLVPTGEPVGADDHKLVFVIHDGEHYLREIWNANGRHVVTSQLNSPLQKGDTETEIRLLEQKRDSQRARQAEGSSQRCVADAPTGNTCR